MDCVTVLIPGLLCADDAVCVLCDVDGVDVSHLMIDIC